MWRRVSIHREDRSDMGGMTFCANKECNLGLTGSARRTRLCPGLFPDPARTGRNPPVFWLITLAMALEWIMPNPLLAEAPRVATAKQYRSRFFDIHAVGVAPPTVRTIGESADRFFEELSHRWSVNLEEKRVPLRLGTDTSRAPYEKSAYLEPWVSSRVDSRSHAIAITVHGRLAFDAEPVVRAVRRETVKYYLRDRQTVDMPEWLEEGLALHFAVPYTSRDKIRSIWAFRRHDNVASLFDSQRLQDRNDQHILGFTFVHWLARAHRGQMGALMHELLLGKTVPDSLNKLNMPPLEGLVRDFDQQVRPWHHWAFLFLTRDFLFSLLGVALVGFALWRVVDAIQIASLNREFQRIAMAAEREVPDPELFTGPVFGGLATPDLELTSSEHTGIEKIVTPAGHEALSPEKSSPSTQGQGLDSLSLPVRPPSETANEAVFSDTLAKELEKQLDSILPDSSDASRSLDDTDPSVDLELDERLDRIFGDRKP